MCTNYLILCQLACIVGLCNVISKPTSFCRKVAEQCHSVPALIMLLKFVSLEATMHEATLHATWYNAVCSMLVMCTLARSRTAVMLRSVRIYQAVAEA